MKLNENVQCMYLELFQFFQILSNFLLTLKRMEGKSTHTKDNYNNKYKKKKNRVSHIPNRFRMHEYSNKIYCNSSPPALDMNCFEYNMRQLKLPFLG